MWNQLQSHRKHQYYLKITKTKQQYVIYCYFNSQLYTSGSCADRQPCSDILVEHHCQCLDRVVMTINTWKPSKQCCSNQKLTLWHGFLVKGLIVDESHDWQLWYTNIVGQHCCVGTRGINCNHIKTINNISKRPKLNNNMWFIATSKANYTLLEVVLMGNHAQMHSWNIIVNVLTVW
jgi:hypothetical protein